MDPKNHSFFENRGERWEMTVYVSFVCGDGGGLKIPFLLWFFRFVQNCPKLSEIVQNCLKTIRKSCEILFMLEEFWIFNSTKSRAKMFFKEIDEKKGRAASLHVVRKHCSFSRHAVYLILMWCVFVSLRRSNSEHQVLHLLNLRWKPSFASIQFVLFSGVWWLCLMLFSGGKTWLSKDV